MQSIELRCALAHRRILRVRSDSGSGPSDHPGMTDCAWRGTCLKKSVIFRCRAKEPPMSGHSNASPVIAIPGADPRLYNHDLAPVAPEARTWGVFSIFAMWMSDVHSVGGYTFAASLFFLGLTGWEVLLAMIAGITAVYFLRNLIGRPSLKYGTPFPVVARMAFGIMGANIAAGLRGIVGIVWYGVQTYFASKAVQVLVLAFYPAAEALTHGDVLGLSALGWFS